MGGFLGRLRTVKKVGAANIGFLEDIAALWRHARRRESRIDNDNTYHSG